MSDLSVKLKKKKQEHLRVCPILGPPLAKIKANRTLFKSLASELALPKLTSHPSIEKERIVLLSYKGLIQS